MTGQADSPKEPASSREASRPWLLADYLPFGEFSPITPEGVDETSEEAQVAIDKTEKKIRPALRAYWFLGRCRAEVLEYKLAFDGESFARTNLSVAKKLQLSAAAVGGWFNQKKGIGPQNLELFRRYFADLVELARPSDHELDLGGYIHALAEPTHTPNVGPELPSEVDFFRLWYIYQSELWLEACKRDDQQLGVIAADDINTSVHSAMGFLQHYREKRRHLFLLPDEIPIFPRNFDASFDRLRNLADGWGASFVSVVHYLDEICWTPPHAT